MLTRLAKRANARLYPRRLLYGPEWIVLGVNNVCNLHCKMCDVGVGFEPSNFYQNLMGARPLNMPIELLRQLLDQVARFFPAAKIGYAYTEPILYPHLLESLSHAERLGLFTSLTTNGTKLARLAADLAAAGLDAVLLSLDGPPEIHNEIRGHPQSFQWARDGMEAIAVLPGRRPEMSVYCTITQWNVGHLERFLRSFVGLPLREVGFLHTNFTPREVAELHNRSYGARYPATTSNVEAIEVAAMDLDLLWEEIGRIRRGDWPFPVVFSPQLLDRESVDRFYLRPGELIGSLCNDAFRTLMVKSDGTAIPAHGRCYALTVGNLYETDLAAVWNAPLLARFRRDLVAAGGLMPACSRCCSAF